MTRDLHLFQAGGLRLAFVPVTDSLFVVDAAGWDALRHWRAGLPDSAIRERVAAKHGAAAAAACLEEIAGLAETHGLGEPDPLAGDATAAVGAPERGDAPRTGATAGGDAWLPSSPEAPLLKSLCLNVAHDCDLRCRYCFAGQGGFGGERGLMPAAIARAAVDFLIAHAGPAPTLEIDFFGGEPLLNLEVVRETVDYARWRGAEAGKRFGFTLTTNALSLGPDEATYLDKTMDNVVLSLDGRPEVHDRMRPRAGGRPSHARILENILGFVARRGERDYWVRGTYTAYNLDFADDVIYLARQGIRNISLEPAVGGPTGAGHWGLTLEHVPALAAEYLRLADFLHMEETAGRSLRFFHFIAETDAGPCYAKRVRGCGAGREYMAVTPDGGLYPCHQFVGREGFRLGGVGEGLTGPGAPSPTTAAAGSPAAPGVPAAPAVGALWLGSKSDCRACWARYRCSGGCHANHLAATGSLLLPDPLGCALLKARLEASLYLQARRAVEFCK